MVYICSVVKLICYLLLAYFRTNTFAFFVIYFFIVLSNLYISIICEYLLVLSSKKANENNEDKNENHLPIFFGFRCAGSVIGNLLGGFIIERRNLFINFYISSLVPMVGTLIGFLYNE